jgi:hypothetical protein
VLLASTTQAYLQLFPDGKETITSSKYFCSAIPFYPDSSDRVERFPVTWTGKFQSFNDDSFTVTIASQTSALGADQFGSLIPGQSNAFGAGCAAGPIICPKTTSYSGPGPNSFSGTSVFCGSDNFSNDKTSNGDALRMEYAVLRIDCTNVAQPCVIGYTGLQFSSSVDVFVPTPGFVVSNSSAPASVPTSVPTPVTSVPLPVSEPSRPSRSLYDSFAAVIGAGVTVGVLLLAVAVATCYFGLKGRNSVGVEKGNPGSRKRVAPQVPQVPQAPQAGTTG